MTNIKISLRCSKCGQEYNFEEIERIANVHRQLTRVSRNKTYYSNCMQCGRKVATRSIKENYNCPQCESDKKKKEIKMLDKRKPKKIIDFIEKKETKNQIGFECEECGDVLSSELTLKKHILGVHKKNLFRKKDGDSKGIMENKVGKNRYYCDVCDEDYRGKDKYNIHTTSTMHKHNLIKGASISKHDKEEGGDDIWQ